jgi:uncharacterized membrane protein
MPGMDITQHPEVAVHLTAALGALGLGLFILCGRKGSSVHRRLGWAWVLLMGTAAASSAFIQGGKLPGLGGFSLIHALTLFVLWQLPRGIVYARQGKVAAHRQTMRGLYIGGCLVAGAFTLLPGRLLGQWLWA